MVVMLSVLSALSYGVADFSGGHASRRLPSTWVTLASVSLGLVVMTVASTVVGGTVTRADVAWALFAGLLGAVGLLVFYTALASGPMRVAAPLSALLSALVPVLLGVATDGLPGALAGVGILLALPATMLIAAEDEPDDHVGSDAPTDARRSRRTAVLALIAGSCFGGYLAVLSLCSDDSGLWPIAIGRISAVALMVAAVTVGSRRGVGVGSVRSALSRSLIVWVLVAGLLDALGNVFYLEAARQGSLALVGAVVGMYPAATVALAMGIHEERPARVQLLGLGLAGVAMVLLTVG